MLRFELTFLTVPEGPCHLGIFKIQHRLKPGRSSRKVLSSVRSSTLLFFIYIKQLWRASTAYLAVCDSNGVKINGADNIIPLVPQITQIRNTQRKMRSITMATYFQSSVICNKKQKVFGNLVSRHKCTR